MAAAEPAKRVRVLIVEDRATVREAIVAEFQPETDFEVVGQAGSVAEARALLAHADVALLDLGLPDGSGLELIPELRTANPTAHAIVLSASFDPVLHAHALEHGAIAMLDKIAHLGQITEAIRQLLHGKPPVPPHDRSQ
jgi:two-component system, NarL family, response regulator DevR